MVPESKKDRGYRAWKKGLQVETLACWYLRLKGYRIAERRYTSPLGEIDIIAQRGRFLVFVEVKSRITMNEAIACVSAYQVRRLFKTAHHYIATHPQSLYKDYRFDLLAFQGMGLPRHIQNAWQEN